jgi:hypothetical protein
LTLESPITRELVTRGNPVAEGKGMRATSDAAEACRML